MDLNKKKRYVNISVAVVIIGFLLLLFTDHMIKACALLFISGGVLGLVTKNVPIYKMPYNPSVINTGYSKNSILGPLLNIFSIIMGLIFLFNS